MQNLTPDEVKRYTRHLILKGFGPDNQIKLKQSKVLVVGAGGLGCPVLLYLAAAGVGSIGTVDSDQVDLSNLQRQVLYTEQDVRKNKAEVAVTKLRQLNSLITYQSYVIKLDSQNALDIIKEYDVVVDATDNFPTRYLLNDACVLTNKPLVYGSILQFEGQVAVFNYLRGDRTFSCNYRDLFPEPPSPESVPNCAEAGVLGVLPGIIGAIQANEVIKIITGIGEPLTDRLLLIDSLDLSQSIIKLQEKVPEIEFGP